jgi:hypothetical protein
MGGVNVALMLMRCQIQSLREQLTAATAKQGQAELRALAAEKLRQGVNLTRPELAAYLGVSTRKIQRMEAAGTPRRCPNLGTVVRYAARDVLRLASAS